MESRTASRPDASRETKSSVFQTVMTPVYVVTFFLSLYFVDYQYNDKRIQEHSEKYSRLPYILDRTIFSPRPYRWVDRKNSGSLSSAGNEERWYYHTKQKKLMKMEAADAFEIQRSVLLGLGTVILCGTLAVWRLGAGFWILGVV
ncbi:hypothetical protein F4804DRAFT_163565 [Jackrogersella minutella]|nr:hypothetical protein F4804DRAFT_163565 [Jackrogersella minutella]